MVPSLAGRVIKGYELREEIGAGGFGVVYRAYQASISREVAIKIILPDYANQTEFIRRFETEAQLVARLENLHTVPLYDFWREPDSAYLVMRYFKGGSARDRLKTQGPWSIEDASRLLSQMAAALAVAHRSQIVHRDMKPDNVLLDENDNFFLADFGIAKDLGKLSLHQTGHIVGSPAYLSPEQIKGETVTPFTDQYGLGICVFELLTGQHPFAGGNAHAMIYKHLSEPLPPIESIRTTLPEPIDAVIQRATSKQPDNRYPDILTFAAAFNQAISGYSGTFASEGNTTIIERALIDTPRTPVMIDLPPPENPYKGLRAFAEADSDDFFGREALVRKLTSDLENKRFVTVVGSSGSGKSSVVHAGLVPHLRRGGIAGSRNWFYVVMHPDRDPFVELESALLGVAVNPPESLRAQLLADERGLLRAIKRTLPDDDSELLLVIDQFEELFTLVEDQIVRSQFLKTLAVATLDPRSHLRVIVTLRADFYDRPLMHPTFGEIVRETTQIVLPLNRDELERAIVSPAGRVGLLVEPTLIDQIIADVGESSGALPMLQYALTELFERRDGRVLTSQAYKDIGGVSGALARRAEDLFVELGEPTKIAARQVFLRLINLGEGTEDTRRRAFQSELLSLNPADGEDAVEYVLGQFGKYRLLTFDNDPQTREPTVEIAHEALIREWVRLRAWLEHNRDDLRVQRRLSAAAAEWIYGARDASFLASGTRLEQFREWREATDLTLNQQERDYLDVSIAAEDVRLTEEAERLAREQALEQRSLRRLQAFVVLATVTAVLSMSLMFYAFSQTRTARQNAAVAESERQLAERNSAEANSLALAASAQQALSNGDNDLAITLALESARIDSPPTQAQRVLARAAYTPGTVRVYQGHTNFVLGAAFSPDGQTFASASADGTLRLWDLATGVVLQQFAGHTAAVNDVAISPTGTHLLSASADGTARLWQIESGGTVALLETNGGALSVAFTPDGSLGLVGDAGGAVQLWGLNTYAVVGRFTGHDGPVYDIAMTPRGQSFLTAGGDGTVRDWSISAGQEIRRYLVSNEPRVFSVMVSPQGLTALSGAENGVIHEWDTRFGQELRSLFGHTDDVNALVFTPDGRQAVSASDDGTIRLWNAENGEEQLLLRGHTAPITTLAISPNGRLLISGSEDGELRLWDLRPGAETTAYDAQSDVDYIAAAIDSKSGVIAAGTRDGTLHLWDLATGELVTTFVESSTPGTARTSVDDIVNTVAISPNDRMTAFGTRSGIVGLWHIPSRTQLRQIAAHESTISAVAFSPDSRYLISASTNSSFIRTDIASGETVFKETILGEIVRDMVFLPNTPHSVLVGTNNGSLLVLDAEMGMISQRLGDTNSAILSVFVSDDGSRAVTGSEDGSVQLWDIETGAQLLRMEGHNSAVTGIAMSKNGQFAISSSTDRNLIVWDIGTGTAIQQIEAHPDEINDVLLLTEADGEDTFAITASSDGTLRKWQILPLTDLIAWTQSNRHGAELSCVQREQYRVPPYCTTPSPPTTP